MASFALAVVALALMGVACNIEPDPTATPDATATVAPTASTGLVARLAEIEDRVIEIRGIPRPEPVPYRFVTPEELTEVLEENLADAEVVEDLAVAEKLYKLLGLIPQDSDLGQLYLDLQSGQVLGLYDSEKKEFLIRQTGDELGVTEEITYAHEYVHRLQDAKFDLEAMLTAVEDDDETAMALRALVEGDAVAVQSLYALEHIGLGQFGALFDEATAAQAQAADIPYILRVGLEFPYTTGLQFATRLQTEGGFEMIDEAYADPPTTTEQIIHPEKYLDREDRIPVDAPADAFGEGWNVVYENVFGEFFLESWLEALGLARSAASVAAVGWGGDRYVLLENDEGQSALASLVAWDDPDQDSGEFAEGMASALDGSPNFERRQEGIPNAIVLWDGPGGVVGLARLSNEALGGGAIAMAAAPEAGLVMEALSRMAGVAAPAGG